MKKTKWIIALIIALIALRVLFPSVDPPLWFSQDLGLFADEGYKTHSARNVVLFGDTKTSELDSYLGWNRLSPVTHRLFTTVFSLFGVGYVQARLINLILSSASLLIFYFITQKLENRKFAIYATATMGVNFVYLVYSKIALLETVVTFFLLLSVLFWTYGRNKSWMLIFSIASFLLAYLSKPLAIFFLPVLLFMVYDALFKNASRKNLVIGVMSAAALGLLAFILFPDVAQRFISLIAQRTPDSLAIFMVTVRRFWSEEFFLYNIVLYIGFLGYLFLFIGKTRNIRSIKSADVLFLLWTISAFILLILQFYRPIRYFVPLTPALIYLSVRFVMDRKQMLSDLQHHDKLRGWLYRLLILIILMITFANTYKPLRDFIFPGLKEIKIFYFMAALGASLAGSYGLHLMLKRIKGNGEYLKKAMIVAYLIANLIPIGIWYSSPQYSLVESSRDMAMIIPSDASIMGINWAQALCMETRNKCYKVVEGYNEDNDMFRGLEITYFISDDYNDPDYDVEFLRNMNFEKSITHIKNYTIGRFEIALYRFDSRVFYSEEVT